MKFKRSMAAVLTFAMIFVTAFGMNVSAVFAEEETKGDFLLDINVWVENQKHSAVMSIDAATIEAAKSGEGAEIILPYGSVTGLPDAPDPYGSCIEFSADYSDNDAITELTLAGESEDDFISNNSYPKSKLCSAALKLEPVADAAEAYTLTFTATMADGSPDQTYTFKLLEQEENEANLLEADSFVLRYRDVDKKYKSVNIIEVHKSLSELSEGLNLKLPCNYDNSYGFRFVLSGYNCFIKSNVENAYYLDSNGAASFNLEFTSANGDNSVTVPVTAVKEHKPGAAATCGSAQTCTTCGETLAPATGAHKPGAAATCTTAQICTVCKTTLKPATGIHTYGAYATTKKATFGKAGVKTAKCNSCSKTVTKAIKAVKTPVLSATAYTFNNKAKTPAVTVKDTAGNKVSYSTSYASGRKNVGKYAVKVTLKGADYSGSKTVYFKINPKGVAVSKLSKEKKEFTVKWKKPSSTYRKQMTGYEIRYSTSSKMTKAKTVAVKSTTATSKTIKKLSAKKNYYVQIRTYKTVKGVKYCSDWSKAKKVKTK